MTYRFARKQYKARRHFIIHLQSHIRSLFGRKQLVSLRAEARSANHFKEVSYKLENKVVELTQTITAMTSERDKMNDRMTALETEIKTWMIKYEKLEQTSKENETKLNEPTVSQSEWDTLKQEHDMLSEKYTTLSNDLKARERDMATLQEQLEHEKQENATLQQQLMSKDDHYTEESEVVELRNQVAALKQQLAQAMRAPRSSRGLSPAIGRSVSPSPAKGATLESTGYRQRSRSPGLLHRKVRRSSMAGTSVSTEPVQHITKNPRPTSIDQYSSLLGTTRSSENPQQEVKKTSLFFPSSKRALILL